MDNSGSPSSEFSNIYSSCPTTKDLTIQCPMGSKIPQSCTNCFIPVSYESNLIVLKKWEGGGKKRSNACRMQEISWGYKAISQSTSETAPDTLHR